MVVLFAAVPVDVVASTAGHATAVVNITSGRGRTDEALMTVQPIGQHALLSSLTDFRDDHVTR